jgi:3-deoxy-D-manno-octulosonic-acid transferase
MLLYGLLIFLYSLTAIVSWQVRGLGRPIHTYYGADLPELGPGPVYWIHAVSVGEAKAVAPIAQRLKAQGGTLIVSSITATGHAEAKRSIPEADHHIYLPFDIPLVMRRLVGKVQPDLLVLSEGDYWPAFMREIKRNGGKIAVVNAKLSERSMRRHKQFKWISRRLLGPVDLFCVQGETYLERFKALGIAAELLVVTGNLKYDAKPPIASGAGDLRAKLKLGEGPVITLGSTHDPEEKELLGALRPLLKKHAELKILLVPRHPDRFDEVAALADGRYTAPISGEERILCIDAMGLLNDCYRLSAAAVVAGSYGSKVGGHNVLEPIFFGVPSFFGPHMHLQPDMETLVREHGAGEQSPLGQLADRLDRVLADAALRAQFGQAGEQLLTAISGSVDRTWAELEKKCFPVATNEAPC